MLILIHLTSQVVMKLLNRILTLGFLIIGISSLYAQTIHSEVENYDWESNYQEGTGPIFFFGKDYKISNLTTIIDIYEYNYNITSYFKIVAAKTADKFDSIRLLIPFHYNYNSDEQEEDINERIENYIDRRAITVLINQDTINFNYYIDTGNYNLFANHTEICEVLYQPHGDSLLNVEIYYEGDLKFEDIKYSTGIGKFYNRKAKLGLIPKSSECIDSVLLKFRNNISKDINLYIDSVIMRDSISYLLNNVINGDTKYNDLLLEVDGYYVSKDLLNNTIGMKDIIIDSSNSKLFDKNPETNVSLVRNIPIKVFFPKREKILGLYFLLDSSYYNIDCDSFLKVPLSFNIEIYDALNDSVYSINKFKELIFRCGKYSKGNFAYLVGESQLYNSIDYPEFTITNIFNSDTQEPYEIINPYIKSFSVKLVDENINTINFSEIFIISIL